MLDLNKVARQLQRLGVSGTEEEIEASLESAILTAMEEIVAEVKIKLEADHGPN